MRGLGVLCNVVGCCCVIFVCFFYKFESKTEGSCCVIPTLVNDSNFYVHGCDFRFCFLVWFCSVVGVVMFFCLMSLRSVWFQFVCVLVFVVVFLLWCFVY